MQATTAAEVQALGKFRAFLRSVRAWLRGVLGTVAGIEKARREGKLKEGDNFGALVDTMLGLHESKFSKAVESEAGAMLGETHSLTPFKPAKVISKIWNKRIDDWQATGSAGDKPVHLGMTPAVLQLAGAGELPLMVPPSLLTKVTKDVHAVPIEALRALPESLADPVAVFQSRTQPDSLVVLTEYTEGSKPVIIAVTLDKQAGRDLMVNQVASIYGKGAQTLADMFGELLLYENKEKSSAWARREGLQLPKRGTPTQNSERSIPGPDDIVKQGNDSHSLSPVRRMELVENRLAVVLNQDSEQARKFAERGNERLGRLKSRYAGVPAPKTKAELDKQQAGMVEARRVELDDVLTGEVEARLGGVNNLATSLRAHPLGSYLLRSDMRRKRLYLGGIMPESRWRAEQLVNLGLPEDGKAQGGSYDGAGDLPGYFFRGNQRPDDVAKEAFGLGLLDGDSAEDLYNGIGAMLNELATNKADMQRYREQLREARQSAKEEAEYEGRAWRAEEDEKQAFLANPRDAADAVKGVGDLSILPQLSVTPRLGDGRGNIFIMDIKVQIQYFFAPPLHMWWVDCSLLGSSGSGSTPLPEHADRPRQKQPAKDRQPAHHAFFNPTCCASAPLAQVGPQP